MRVKKLSDQSLRVGNKVVKMNSDGDWQEVTELTELERQAVADYLIKNNYI